MIIFRYFAREIFSTLLAVTGLLLLIFLSNQFIRYLADAAAGELSIQFVMRIMLLEIPNLLGLLLPLATFLAVILAFGRMYADNEMTILSASGFSQKSLVLYTVSITSIVALIVAVLSLKIGPYISADRARLISMGQSTSIIETIVPGRFQSLDGGKKVVYVERVSRDHNEIEQIFGAERIPQTNSARIGPEWTILTAKQGKVIDHPDFASRYFLAEKGQRYEGVAGEKDFQIAHFDEYGVRMKLPSIKIDTSDIRGTKTSELWPINNKNHSYAAELQWRLSIPLSTLILTFIAVPLSYVKPRQGKYAKIVPAILILISYANMMFVVRDWLSNDFISPSVGFWWLHILFIGLGFLLLFSSKITYFFKPFISKTS